MIILSRLCLRCRKMVQVERGSCPDCGLQIVADGQNGHFLSGPFVPGRTGVVLPTGATLMDDRFRIVQQIGNGRFSSVYLAEDMLRSIQVALKIIEVGPQSEEIATLLLQHEMTIYSKISNFQHVIKVYDLHLVPWGGTSLLLLSMEYANGGTFRKWLMDHQQDWEGRRTKGLDYFKEACRGVGDAHQVNVVHLDPKPENFLFLDGVLKVSDFGAAICAQLLQKASGFFCETLPSELGSPVYMSPEHFTAAHLDDLDERTDIYSCGVILYELVHPKGRRPFEGSYERLRQLHIEVPAPRLPEAGEKLGKVIARCLEKNPAHRYQSVAELLDDLEERPNNIKLEASTEETEKNLEETWERASLLFSQGDLNEAARLTEKVLDAQPEHPGARHLKEELSSRFSQAEQFYQEIARGNGGDLSELIELLQEAVSIYPEHPAGRLVQVKLGARARHNRNALEEGLKALKEERWESALEWFRQTLKHHPEAADLGPIIGILTKIEDLRREIHEALAKGEFRKALRLARLVDLLVEQMKRAIPALRERKT